MAVVKTWQSQQINVWVQVPVLLSSSRRGNCGKLWKDYKFVKHINVRDMWTWKETKKMYCQQKGDETKWIPIQKMSENKFASNNFDKVELHVHSHD